MADYEEQVQGIYVDIDALLDTRIATLEFFDEKYLEANGVNPNITEAALNSNYFNREEDSFPGISKDLFSQLYSMRNHHTLSKANYTNILGVIQDAVKKLTVQSYTTPFTSKITLTINVFPYILNEDEISVIKQTMTLYTASKAEIFVISKKPEELYPRDCQRDFSLMIKYNDYDKWLDEHARTGALRINPLTNVTLLVPRLYLARIPTPAERQKFKAEKTDPFSLNEKYWRAIVELKCLPMNLFCFKIEKPVKPVEPEKT